MSHGEPQIGRIMVGTVCLVATIDLHGDVDEVAFNKWYDEEHAVERMACPGFQSVTRLRSSDGATPRYITIYELDSEAALTTPEYLALAMNQSPRTEMFAQRMLVRVRNTYDVVWRASGQDVDSNPGAAT
jgi:hypothetical protein